MLPDSERERVEVTLSLIPDGCASVLDVGCGDGRITNRIRAANVMGVDVQADGLKRVQVPTRVASAVDLPFADRAFDVVVCCEVLEHLEDHVLARALGELARVARVGLVITTPHREDLLLGSSRCNACGHRFNLSGHVQSFTPDRVRRLLPGWRRERLVFFGRKSEYESGLWVRLLHATGGGWRRTATPCPACGGGDIGGGQGILTPVIQALYWRWAAIAGRWPQPPYWMGMRLMRDVGEPHHERKKVVA